eukprot:s33_g50.t1
MDAERRRSDVEMRLAALEEAAAKWEARALEAEAAVAAERRRAGDEAAACEAQRQRERHLAAEALERERRHSGRLSDAVACLEEQLADRSKVMAELTAQAEELSDRARALEVKAQEQHAMSEEPSFAVRISRLWRRSSSPLAPSVNNVDPEVRDELLEAPEKELQQQLQRKEQALATEGMSFASMIRSASAKEVAAQKLLADTERRSEELARREGDVQRTAEPWLIGKILDLGTQIVGGVYWKPVFRIVSAGPEAVHSVTHARSYLESNFFVGWRSGRRNFAVSDGDSSSQECFESERQHLVEECRQEVEREKSELRARLQLREDRVNSHLADCNRRAEVELENLGPYLGRRLSLLASREASAAEALRQKQQIQDQAKTIEDLQHQLERQKEKSGYPGSEAPSHNQAPAFTLQLVLCLADHGHRDAAAAAGARKFNGPRYKGTVKKEKPKKNKAANKPQSMDISEPKAPKLTKSQKREKRKQALSLGKVGKTSPKAMPAPSPTLKAVSPKATPEEDTQMKVDVEKSKKRRRKEQRRAIQVHKTQLKKKGQTAHLKS